MVAPVWKICRFSAILHLELEFAFFPFPNLLFAVFIYLSGSRAYNLTAEYYICNVGVAVRFCLGPPIVNPNKMNIKEVKTAIKIGGFVAKNNRRNKIDLRYPPDSDQKIPINNFQTQFF